MARPPGAAVGTAARTACDAHRHGAARESRSSRLAPTTSGAIALGVVALVLMVGAGSTLAATDRGGCVEHGCREDHGALIVLDLHGSYADMGRQEVELLGPLGRELHALYAERWAGVVRRHGLLGRLVNDVVLPLWGSIGWCREDSGFFAEATGIARALGAKDTDGVRGLYGGVFGGGSTAFAATRSATADGGAIFGRNVDWSDDTGRRRPVVTRYHPDNGDMTYLTASWPLIFIPIVGLNEAGLAISINFFDADDMMGIGLPRLLYRRVLQQATTVAEGLALLAEGGNRGGAGIIVLADASGDLAIAECAAKHCAMYHPTDDWVVQSNHTRTAEMRAHDQGRTADSSRRQDAMAAAVQRHLGGITPPVAAEILRDRSNSRFINDSTVANLRVLNAVVVDPTAKTLWHSTVLQPIAPFGEMVPFAVDGETAGVPPLPADPRLGSEAFARQMEAVATMRQAARLFSAGRVGDAGRIWDRLAADESTLLEPHRLAWARARVRWSTGKLAEAEALLAGADVDEAPFEVRAYAIVVRAMIADRQGQRAQALHQYGRAEALLNAHAEYDAPMIVGPVRRWIREGLAAAGNPGPFPQMPDLQNIPQ
jgi:hypothetical protein